MPDHRTSSDLVDTDAITVRLALTQGQLTPSALVEACLARIADREPAVQAWAFLDPAHVRRQAARLDAAAEKGPLFGLPVGVKDIFATADMPTENGTHLHAGRRPSEDSAVVEKLRGAGAVIMGKTVTTEFAAFTPGKTRHPQDPERTPGGSSSGSAAAVAAGMVPLAIGSQTNGSVIRPASYCGVIGFKPSFGLISRRGMTAQAPSVDHVGMFARSLRDIAMLAEVLIGSDPGDPPTHATATPALRQVVAEPPATAPRLAFVKGPSWSEAAPTTREAFTDLAARLEVSAIELPSDFEDVIEVHRRLTWPEIAHQLAGEHLLGPGALSDGLRSIIEGGRAISAPDYLAALARRQQLISAIAALFLDFDAILTPAAAGEAPLGLSSTGSPVFCTPWTLLGTPAVSLPLLSGPSGLPLGVQLVGASNQDHRLLAAAAWLEAALAS